MADLKDGSLERALALLAANDVTDLVTLRRSFTSLASELRKGPRALISNALAATRAVGGPQQPRVEQPCAWCSGARCARSASRAAAPREHAHRLFTRL